MSKLYLVVCLAAASSLSLAAQTISVSSTSRTFGMVGLVAGQTARLNVLNYAPVSPTATNILPVCAVTMKFIDSNGNTLESKTISVMPGKSVSMDYSPVFATAMPQRIQIRATVDNAAVPVAATGATTVPQCSLAPTLEIFDNNTQKTEVVM